MSGLRIITADERMAQKNGIKGVIFGQPKIGKTSLLWTLDPATTLFVDLEAGGLSVQGWGGDCIVLRNWLDARDIACLLSGPNPTIHHNLPYSQAHYEHVYRLYGDHFPFEKYQTIFVDSITVASRLAFHWATAQPEAFSEKTGKPDTRSAYGILAKEMVQWATRLQLTGPRNVWFVGILDQKRDDCKVKYYEPQIEGAKTGLELPGIVDEVIIMAEITPDNGGDPYRAFVCNRPNKWGYPAGDRSGKLDTLEEPHLGKLMDKINMREKPSSDTYNYSLGENQS